MGCRGLRHSNGLLWPRPALIVSRTLLDVLVDLRTATPILSCRWPALRPAVRRISL